MISNRFISASVADSTDVISRPTSFSFKWRGVHIADELLESILEEHKSIETVYLTVEKGVKEPPKLHRKVIRGVSNIPHICTVISSTYGDANHKSRYFVHDLRGLAPIVKKHARCVVNVLFEKTWITSKILRYASHFLRKRDRIYVDDCWFAQFTISLNGVCANMNVTRPKNGVTIDVTGYGSAACSFHNSCRLTGTTQSVTNFTLSEPRERIMPQEGLREIFPSLRSFHIRAYTLGRTLPEMTGVNIFPSTTYDDIIDEHVRYRMRILPQHVINALYCGEPGATELAVVVLRNIYEARYGGFTVTQNVMIHESTQSVHVAGLEMSIRSDMDKLIADARPVDVFKILTAGGMSEQHLSSIRDYWSSDRYRECANAVVCRATKLNKEEFATFVQRFSEEIDEGTGMCLDGRTNRMINALSGLVPELTMGISSNEDISNQCVLINRKMAGASSEEKKIELRKILLERGYSEEEMEPWLDVM